MTVKTKDELKAYFLNGRNPPYLEYVNFIDSIKHIDSYSLGEVIGQYLALNGLRGFWPYSVRNANNDLIDISGQTRHLTSAGSNTAYNTVNSGLPYALYDGSSGYHYFNGTFTNITGGLTFGGWFKLDANDNRNALITKFTATGNLSWALRRLESATYNKVWDLFVSGTGSDVIYVRSPSAASPETNWYFVVGRYTPSTELKLIVNDTSWVNTTSIPASTYASTANLCIGSISGGGSYLDGRATLCFVCAEALKDAELTTLYNMSKTLFI